MDINVAVAGGFLVLHRQRNDVVVGIGGGPMVALPMPDDIVVARQRDVFDDVPRAVPGPLFHNGLEHFGERGFRKKVVEAVSLVRNQQNHVPAVG
jgi:hypothetical protein